MFNKLFGKPLIMTLIFLLTILTVTPSLASASSNEGLKGNSNQVESIWLDQLKDIGYSEVEVEKLVEEVNAIKDYFKVDQNNIYFDAENARKNGVNEELVSRTESDMNRLSQVSTNQISALASCAGITGYYGPQDLILLDNCVVNNITYWIGYGANLTTIAGILLSGAGVPAGVGVGVAGVLINMGAQAIDNKNRGYGIAILLRGTGTSVVAQ